MTIPSGRDASTSASFAFTRSMVARAFSPKRMTTIPPTTSPRPSRSATPRRTSGAVRTVATSRTRTGTPWSDERTTTSPMSSMPCRYPSPRIMYSRSASSRTMAPTSSLAPLRASMTWVTGIPKPRSFAGSTMTSYARSYPPTVATSLTPGTDVSW